MGKRRKKKAKAIREAMREALIASLERIRDRMQAEFVEMELERRPEMLQEAIDSYRRDNAANPPERCPCGEKWKNCRHRDELLGTHH